MILHGVCSFLQPASGESLTLRAAEELVAFARRQAAPRSSSTSRATSSTPHPPPAGSPQRLARALAARGGRLERYVGVDDGDGAFLTDRVARELAREGLEGTFIAHDLAAGLPPLTLDGPVLVTSCWGITYRPVRPERPHPQLPARRAPPGPPLPVNTRLGLLEKQGQTLHAVDRSGRWGQTVHVALRP